MSLKHALRYAFCIGVPVLAKPLELRASSDTTISDIQLHPASDRPLPGPNSSLRSNESTVSLSSSSDAATRRNPISIVLPLAFNQNPASNTSVNGTRNNNMRIQCDGASYGFNLDIDDCEQAKAEIPASADEFQWAERHTGWQKRIETLPYRSMGDKASCYVQTVLIGNAASAKASLNQIRNAAASIRNTCASGGKLQGGIATNIGE